jgi:hypothetical protein
MNLRCFNPQFFIGSRVGDTALDQEWGPSGRTYDYRMEVLIEAAKVLAAAVPTERLTPADQLVLEQLKALAPVLPGERPAPPQWRLALRR